MYLVFNKGIEIEHVLTCEASSTFGITSRADQRNNVLRPSHWKSWAQVPPRADCHRSQQENMQCFE